jgi:hypothetical protein
LTDAAQTVLPRRAAPMPSTPEAQKHLHDFVVAATIHVDQRLARYAEFRQSFRAKEDTLVEVLEVYCAACKRPLDDVADEPCSALINNEHLRGGPIGERAKRKPLPDFNGGERIPGPRINRRGIEAYVGGGAQ